MSYGPSLTPACVSRTARTMASRALSQPTTARRGVPSGLGEPAPGHFEDADLVGRTETVFYGAEDTEVPAALAFEGNDRIDHMFDDAGTGTLAVLCDMPNKNHRRSGCLRKTDQC